MSEWIPVVLAIVGSGGVLTLVLTGVGKWVTKRQDARAARELAYLTRIKELQEEVKALQQEIRAMLQDRIKYELVRGDLSAQTMKVLTELVSLLRTEKGIPL